MNLCVPFYKNLLLFILSLLLSISVYSQEVVFSEDFNELRSIDKWTFNKQVEYAHFLGVDGSNYVRFNPVSIRVDLVSPAFNAPNGDYMLYFDWNQARENVPDSVTIFLSLNDGRTWKELSTFGMGNQRLWQTDSISLGLIGGENIKIRFTRRGQRGFPAQYLNLDNISVKKLDKVTSLKDNSLDISLSLFPNPSNGIIQLTISNPLQLNLNYSVYNTIGQLVKEKKIANSVYLNEYVDLSFLPKGNYLFVLTDNQKTATYSIVIQ
jgi:hypothetical protein